MADTTTHLPAEQHAGGVEDPRCGGAKGLDALIVAGVARQDSRRVRNGTHQPVRVRLEHGIADTCNVATLTSVIHIIQGRQSQDLVYDSFPWV